MTRKGELADDRDNPNDEITWGKKDAGNDAILDGSNANHDAVTWDEFIQNTTVHGVRYIFDKTHVIRRFVNGFHSKSVSLNHYTCFQRSDHEKSSVRKWSVIGGTPLTIVHATNSISVKSICQIEQI